MQRVASSTDCTRNRVYFTSAAGATQTSGKSAIHARNRRERSIRPTNSERPSSRGGSTRS